MIKNINLYILGYNSKEVLNYINDLLKDELYEQSSLLSFFNIFNLSVRETMDKIKQNIKDSIKNDNFAEVIIYSLNNFSDEDKKVLTDIFDNYSDNRYYQPFFIFFFKNKNSFEEIKNFINLKIEKYFQVEDDDEENENDFGNKEIDIRNFSYFKKDIEAPINIIDFNIKSKLEKIFCYYNELGDYIFKNKDDSLDMDNKDNESQKSLRINILCAGKSQRGKSSFINLLLKEKRAKERGSGKACSSKILKYKVDDIPLNIFDTIGISDDKNGSIMDELISKIKNFQNELKEESLHLILYFIDYNDPIIFEKREEDIFNQLFVGNTQTYYFFVCTKFNEYNSNKPSSKKINNKIQKHIKKVQTSLNDLCSKKCIEIKINDDKNKKVSIIDYLYCCQNNQNINDLKDNIDDNEKLNSIINFEKNIGYINIIPNIVSGMKILRYGIKDTLYKIGRLIDNEKIKNSALYFKLLNNIFKDDLDKLVQYNKLTDKNIDSLLNILEKKAKDKSLSSKISASIVGSIPFFDMIVQNIIKKGVIKDIAEIFGDNLIELNLNEEIKNYQQNEEIKKIEEKINDTNSNIFKSLSRVLTISGNMLNMLFKYVSLIGIAACASFFAVGGIVIGISLGAITICSDVKSIIQFYKERLRNRLINVNNFEPVAKYLTEIE